MAISQTIAEMWKFIIFSIWRDWRPSAILHLLSACLDHLQRAFRGFYGCTKFGWNQCSSVDNMHVFIFHEFGLKMPIHAPKIGVLDDMTT